MTTDRDDRIQESLDRDEPVENSRDVAAYRRVYHELGEQPVELPAGFVETVMARLVEARLSTRESVTMLMAVAGTLLAVACGIGSVFLLRGLGYLEGMSFDLPASLPQGLVYFVVVVAMIASIDAVMSGTRGNAR